MTTSTRVLATLSAAALTTLGAAACSADGADRVDAPRQEATGPVDCAALLPEAALEPLGWSATGAPEVDGATCTLATDGGSVSSQRRPVPAAGEDELEAAATEQFEERCATLASIIDGEAGQEVDWLDGRRACVALPGADRTTSGSLLALVQPTVLVEVGVLADGPVPTDDVRATLTALAEAATR